MAKRKSKRDSVVPFKTLLDRRRGRIAGREFSQTKVKPLTEPVSLSLWFPGEPRAKSQGFATINWKTKPPRAYIAPDTNNQDHEDLLRDRFLDIMEEQYPHVIPYLPIVEGAFSLRAYFLMKPGENWWPGKQYTHSPDDENLVKIVADALCGRQTGRGSFLYHDDCMKIGTIVVKEYWSPEAAMNPHLPDYPMEPGSFIVVDLIPMVRHPDWLPREEGTCPVCGRHNFKARWAFQKHVRKCAIPEESMVNLYKERH